MPASIKDWKQRSSDNGGPVGFRGIADQRRTIAPHVQSDRLQFDQSRTGRLAEVNGEVIVRLHVLSQTLAHPSQIDRVPPGGDLGVAIVPTCQIDQRQPT